MDTLATKRCVPCEGGVKKYTREEAEASVGMITGWGLNEDATALQKDFTFKDFESALLFVNEVGSIAAVEGHHPDIVLSWGSVGMLLTTHAIGGLSENDFILAAKIDMLRS
jgi:4a-hydroxytetrahydrobiopterin dehydratase